MDCQEVKEMSKLLIVEDDRDLLEGLAFSMDMESEGYEPGERIHSSCACESREFFICIVNQKAV